MSSDISRRIPLTGEGRSLGGKISGGRGRSLANILIPLERQLNALQLCRWQFLYNETLQQTFLWPRDHVCVEAAATSMWIGCWENNLTTRRQPIRALQLSWVPWGSSTRTRRQSGVERSRSEQLHTVSVCVYGLVHLQAGRRTRRPNLGLVDSRPSDHYFRSVCWFVCLSVCLFVCSCRVFLSRLWSDFNQTRTYVICLGLVVSPRI